MTSSHPNIPAEFVRLLVRAQYEAQDIRVSDAIALMAMPQSMHIIDQVSLLSAMLSEYGLDIEPPISIGPIDMPRVVRRARANRPISLGLLHDAVSKGECHDLEFKSSLMFDHRMSHAIGKSHGPALKSEEVIHSALKSIAGFLNASGGDLWIGVTDGSSAIGINFDYQFLHVEHRSRDGWEVELRNLIDQRFHEGAILNEHIDVAFVELDGKDLARIKVSRRKHLSLYRRTKTDAYRLYVRQGNGVREITMLEIEEYLAGRT